MLSHRLLSIARGVLIAALLGALPSCALFKKKNHYAGVDGDSVSGTPLPERQEGVSFLGDNVDRNRFSPVHFGFDSYVVEPSETGKLDTVAQFLKSSAGMLIIAGFTDERGTQEYNRSLGEKRALAVREALIAKGMKANNVQTVSFGSEMPVDSASNEAAWAKNRRAEFGIVK